MKINQIRFRLENFRAIKDADIILDGITVVAGENGCGKSTLSKFLYYVFKISNEYDKLVDKELRIQLRDIYYFIERFNREIFEWEEGTLFSKEINLSYSLNKGQEWKDAVSSLYTEYIEKVESLGVENRSEKKRLEYKISRIHRILTDILNSDKKKINTEDTNLSKQFEQLNLKIDEYFKSARERIQRRPSDLLIKTLSKSFSTNKLPDKYAILEYDTSIISNDDDTLTKAFYVQQIAYLDTPMLLGVNISRYDYWGDTNLIFQENPILDYDNSINSTINNDILNGESSYQITPYPNNQFIYKREDGSEFDLLECATGVKSFAMLQMMLKNGFLNKYTLLIIDEPESHLHPQWIVEYARLIVLLNKHIGVKFFIASHNPDMVSAIKYISEAEEIDLNLNFYVAERNNPSYTYSYKHLGTDIEAIFESFNIALDRISLYGTKKDPQ